MAYKKDTKDLKTDTLCSIRYNIPASYIKLNTESMSFSYHILYIYFLMQHEQCESRAFQALQMSLYVDFKGKGGVQTRFINQNFSNDQNNHSNYTFTIQTSTPMFVCDFI